MPSNWYAATWLEGEDVRVDVEVVVVVLVTLGDEVVDALPEDVIVVLEVLPSVLEAEPEGV